MSAIPKPLSVVPKPRLSDRNLARFVHMSASRQMRFLHDQKYPKGTPQVFMQPYYAKAIASIRDVMKRDFPGIVDARAKVQAITQETRRRNSSRVLESYIASPHFKRRLKIVHRIAVKHMYATWRFAFRRTLWRWKVMKFGTSTFMRKVCGATLGKHALRWSSATGF